MLNAAMHALSYAHRAGAGRRRRKKLSADSATTTPGAARSAPGPGQSSLDSLDAARPQLARRSAVRMLLHAARFCIYDSIIVYISYAVYTGGRYAAYTYRYLIIIYIYT